MLEFLSFKQQMASINNEILFSQKVGNATLVYVDLFSSNKDNNMNSTYIAHLLRLLG